VFRLPELSERVRRSPLVFLWVALAVTPILFLIPKILGGEVLGTLRPILVAAVVIWALFVSKIMRHIK
jgi:hypothetical protein